MTAFSQMSNRNYRHGNSKDRQRQERQAVIIPGFSTVEIPEEIPRPSFRIGEMIVERQPEIRYTIAHHTTILDCEFYVQKSYGKWTATSPQMTKWEYEFDILTPVSEIFPTLEGVVLFWLSDGEYSQYDGAEYGLSNF